MDPQQAVNAALNAGQADATEVILKEAASRTQHAYETIKANRDISEEYRQALITQTYQDNAAAVANSLTALVETATRTDRSDAERVFGTAGLPGDTASLSISRRDAGDRVAKATTAADLSAILARATRSGDEVLARAAVERAVEIQASDVVNEFTATRPHLYEATERLWARGTQGRDMGRTLVVGGLLAAMRPPR